MSLLKRLFYTFSCVVPFELLVKASRGTSLFPYHHIVSNEEVQHIIHLYPYKNVKQFKEDLDYLLARYKPIEPVELVKYIQQHHQLPPNRFLFSFDDGFREVIEVIAPILKSKGVPAIFFVNPAFIDNKEMFYRNKISLILGSLKSRKECDFIYQRLGELLAVKKKSFAACKAALLRLDQGRSSVLDDIADILDLSFVDYLLKVKPWLTSQELEDLRRQGFHVGAHSWSHPYYQKLPLQAQVKETTDSCTYIRDYNSGCTLFSFPHSDAGLKQQLFDELLLPQNGLDLLFGIQNQKQELQNRTVHRFNAERPTVPINKQVKALLAYTIFNKVCYLNNVTRSYA